jgi:hypothetical protein
MTVRLVAEGHEDLGFGSEQAIAVPLLVCLPADMWLMRGQL